MKRAVIAIAILVAVFAAGFWAGSNQREPISDQPALQQATRYSFNSFKYPTGPMDRDRLTVILRCSPNESKKECAQDIERNTERMRETLTHWIQQGN